jgi:hypothetical protein
MVEKTCSGSLIGIVNWYSIHATVIHDLRKRNHGSADAQVSKIFSRHQSRSVDELNAIPIHSV